MEPLVPSCGIADKVADVVGVRDWRLEQREEKAEALHHTEKTNTSQPAVSDHHSAAEFAQKSPQFIKDRRTLIVGMKALVT